MVTAEIISLVSPRDARRIIGMVSLRTMASVTSTKPARILRVRASPRSRMAKPTVVQLPADMLVGADTEHTAVYDTFQGSTLDLTGAVDMRSA